ncbi:hypothetical protein AGMMS4957_08810 [Bacteroidia bacterium]|nr:hypothetical protein AGMMS4957_08810 [Bacteroidia bacterium]
MKHKFTYLLLAFCLLLVACNSAVEKELFGVTIHLKNVPDDSIKTIRLQVVNDHVIRVSASSANRIATDEAALATFTQGMQEGWTFSSSSNDVILKTGTLMVKVLLANGEVTFMDKDRNIILAGQKDDEQFSSAPSFIICNNKYGIFRDNAPQGDLDYYLVYGSTMGEIVGGYRAVTGKAQILPKWALGLWQSGGEVKEFRDRRFPVDNIVLTGDIATSLDMTEMIEDIHGLNAQFAIAVRPPINWRTMDKDLFSKGVDAWWLNDSCASPAAKSLYEGQRATDNFHRVVIFDGSATPALHQYSVISRIGNTTSSWEGLKNAVGAGITASASGTPYWATDIGGFIPEKATESSESNNNTEEFRELYTRWYQFGAFSPIFLANGTTSRRAPWDIAPEWHNAYSTMLYYTRLRYRLMPYIYSLVAKSHFDDYTMTRPLMMDFAADSATQTVNYQYMFGSALMVCPVYQHKSERREVYFPNGQNWYDVYSGRQIKGGQKLSVSAPYSRMPLFARAGSILPVGSDTIQNTKGAQKNLTVFVYDGGEGEFSLYEDENVNYNYLKGRYTQIPFTYDNAIKKLLIGARTGEFQGMTRKRTITVVLVTRAHPTGIDDALPFMNVRTIEYDGEAQTLSFARDEVEAAKPEDVKTEEDVKPEEDVEPTPAANDNIGQ